MGHPVFRRSFSGDAELRAPGGRCRLACSTDEPVAAAVVRGPQRPRFSTFDARTPG